MMVGRDLMQTALRATAVPGPEVLRVEGLGRRGVLADIDLRLHQGEIVALAGLVGSGRTELARAIFGADRVVRGTVRRSTAGTCGGPGPDGRALEMLGPENRQGGHGPDPIGAGTWSWPDSKPLPRRDQGSRAARAASAVIARLRIATPSPARLDAVSSGGNQQKVVVGKWLWPDCDFFSSTSRRAASTLAQRSRISTGSSSSSSPAARPC